MNADENNSRSPKDPLRDPLQVGNPKHKMENMDKEHLPMKNQMEKILSISDDKDTSLVFNELTPEFDMENEKQEYDKNGLPKLLDPLARRNSREVIQKDRVSKLAKGNRERSSSLPPPASSGMVI
jgi:hypothetical protein